MTKFSKNVYPLSLKQIPIE